MGIATFFAAHWGKIAIGAAVAAETGTLTYLWRRAATKVKETEAELKVVTNSKLRLENQVLEMTADLEKLRQDREQVGHALLQAQTDKTSLQEKYNEMITGAADTKAKLETAIKELEIVKKSEAELRAELTKHVSNKNALAAKRKEAAGS
jgi:chromosome segregation ATPase